jgi:hypothetical protein
MLEMHSNLSEIIAGAASGFDRQGGGESERSKPRRATGEQDYHDRIG